MQTTSKQPFVKKSPDPPVLPTDLQLAASTSDTRPPTPTCTAWRVVWVSTCHHVLFHGHNHVLFHVLEQCRLLSPRLRAHNWSTLARLCPVHLFNLGAETGVLGKGLLHKPVPPLAKAQWWYPASEYHLLTGLFLAESP